MLTRHAAFALVDVIHQFRVVVISGARQVGKSTLAESLPGRHFVTLDDPGPLAAARADPVGFVRGLPLPATIDEVQRAPELLLAVKARVDRERVPGAFVLTGSARLDTLRGVQESLAGRAAVLSLRPFTELELDGAPELQPLDPLLAAADLPALAAHFANKPADPLDPALVLAGGFPDAVLAISDPARRRWFREYRRTYVERDVPGVLSVADDGTFFRFVTLAAASTAQSLEYSRLSRDLGVTVDTMRRWTGVLDMTFVAQKLAPFSRNLRQRLVKTPKLYFADPGLAASLAGADTWEGAQSLRLAGPLVETWVHAQLVAAIDRLDAGRLWFFRTSQGLEVDFVVEAAHKLFPIEVKAGQTVGPKDAASIETFLDLFPREARLGVVAYGGDRVFPLTKRVLAVPLTALFGARVAGKARATSGGQATGGSFEEVTTGWPDELRERARALAEGREHDTQPTPS